MSGDVLIDCAQLQALLAQRAVTLLDCRSDLLDRSFAEREYAAGHLPGAQLSRLEGDLSDMSRVATEGRHPLPDPDKFRASLQRLGVRWDTPVIAYDQGPGMYAARAWWLLRAVGHPDVRVLDGGWAAWRAFGGTSTSEIPIAQSSELPALNFTAMPYRDFAELQQVPAQHALVDARAAARFAGLEEPIDPVAGHIPGARNRPFTENLQAGKFKPPAQLHAEWQGFLEGSTAQQTTHYCGSGVTACHNLLAMEHAGLHGSSLFPPSWSGWIRDPSRPIALGS